MDPDNDTRAREREAGRERRPAATRPRVWGKEPHAVPHATHKNYLEIVHRPTNAKPKTQWLLRENLCDWHALMISQVTPKTQN